MPQLTTLAAGLKVSGNPNLTNLDAFSALTSTATDSGLGTSSYWLASPFTPEWPRVELWNVDVLIKGNPSLVSLAGLGALKYWWQIVIADNDALESLTLAGNNAWSGIYVTENDALKEVHVTNLDSELRALVLGKNSSLERFTLSGSIPSIDLVDIFQNGALADLAGLEPVSRISSLQIDANASLRSVSGYTGPLSSLGIHANPVLPTCATAALAAQLSGGWADIGGNDDSGVCP